MTRFGKRKNRSKKRHHASSVPSYLRGTVSSALKKNAKMQKTSGQRDLGK